MLFYLHLLQDLILLLLLFNYDFALSAGINEKESIEHVSQWVFENRDSNVAIVFKSASLLSGQATTALLEKLPIDFEVSYADNKSQREALSQMSMLSGQLLNVTNSRVYGFIDENGKFQGSIHVNSQWLMIEDPQSLQNGSSGNSYVIYEATTRSCENADNKCSLLPSYRIPRMDPISHNGSLRFCRDGHVITQPVDPLGNVSRYPRSFIPNQTNTCLLHVLIDHTLLKHSKLPGEKTNLQSVILNLQLILREVNDIYRDLKVSINSKSISRPVMFKLKHVAIMTENQCSLRNRSTVCNEDLDINNLLHEYSIANYDRYCLSYLLTARDFHGVLGLAYTSAPGRLGGVCARHMNGRSLNSGVISVINGQRQTSRITVVTTLAHEIAHNLGAEHDPDRDHCTPGGPQGNYLMYAHATDGYKVNNRKFSTCSTKEISATMQRVADGQVFNCLEHSNVSICGNGLTEPGEQCDCGYSDSCNLMKDKCCHPADHYEEALRCTLTTGSKCSPSSGSCCTDSCQYEAAGVECSDSNADSCQRSQRCSGSSAACPKVDDRSDFMPNGQLCNDGTGTCSDGLCSGSLCVFFNASGCELDDASMKGMKAIEQMKAKCTVHCIDKNSGKCVHLEKIANKANLKSVGVIHPIRLPGTICDGGKGYCDIFQLCQPVDNDSPITKLAISLSNKIVSAVKKNWIIAVIIVIIVLLLSMLLIKYCGKYTPSNNPDMKRHKQLVRSRNAASRKSSLSTGTYSQSQSSTSNNFHRPEVQTEPKI